jgi:hypothetical protein
MIEDERNNQMGVAKGRIYTATDQHRKVTSMGDDQVPCARLSSPRLGVLIRRTKIWIQKSLMRCLNAFRGSHVCRVGYLAGIASDRI